MKTAFYLIAAAMIAVALLLLLLPLVRHGRRMGRPRGVFALALAVALVLPLAAAGLYFKVGTPQAMNPEARAASPVDIEQALAQLRQHLAEQPNDVQGWLLLAQTRGAMGRPDEAREAFDRVLKLDANNTAAMVGWAEADAQLQAEHRVQGRARELLQRAVEIDPANQRGLWLLGIGDFQQAHYAEAAATWRRLLPLLEPGSSVAQAVTQQIAAAEARAGGQAPAASPAATSTDGPQLKVEVSLAPALKSRLAGGETLFVYARAEQGPPMPLAVARLDATTLPASVTLTDAMAMLPQHKLSSEQRVFVGARISKSGQARAQAGDLEGDAGVVEVGRSAPLKIVIDHIH
ncbi:tetratricopeptide repeat protein [Frateuria defendens]|uniref:tetratricopeptide repeat protein n=1 Tax=Frateuria defendens TaxID=2219559 RepID=UPI00066FCEB5|nr:tetratricopeptide repeat protein [Frateuria defendens]